MVVLNFRRVLYVKYQYKLTTDMDFEKSQIVFDSPKAVFTLGQTITGRVLLFASSSVIIRSKWNTSEINDIDL